LIWEHAKSDIELSQYGCLVFDDSILDKDHSHHIEMVRRQWSGNAHRMIRGIGMVNCLYVNPESGRYWIIDYRLYDPEGDGKTKLDHAREMLTTAVASKAIPFDRVLMDSWYATKDLMLFIESLGKVYYCPLKNNRQVDDSGGVLKYISVTDVSWSEIELKKGKIIKIKGFPKEHKVKLFRVATTINRTDFVVRNDLGQNSLQDTQKVFGLRWKIEQFHRELKQITGIEKCQCRKSRIQRNHIACCVLVWVRLSSLARKALTTIYEMKGSLISNYLRQELRSPTISMALA
jgi:hypothetical protein